MERVKVDLDAERKAAIAEIKADNASDPWIIADKEGVQLDTPMDSKTIKNAILKRLPEARRIQLVKAGEKGEMHIVVLCQLIHETAIIIEDNANIFMRHKELMNIVDCMWNELIDRKKLRKSNKLPDDFFHTEKQIDLARHSQ